jgi:hypothetical protein
MDRLRADVIGARIRIRVHVPPRTSRCGIAEECMVTR